MNITKNIPENIKGVVLMIAGFALLLHTFGVLADLLWYILVIISLYLIFVGFIKVRGIEAVKCMVTRKNGEVEKTEAQDKNERID